MQRLIHDVAVTQPRTARGLLAKISAIADMYGLDALDDETAFKDGDDLLNLDQAVLTVLRDCARMAPIAI